VDDVTKQRLAANEAVFRAINEQILSLEDRFGSPEAGFVCECADASCAETVQLPLDDYEAIHEDKQRFFVVPGHERADIEEVVARYDTYLVVEKKVPVPELSASTN
jgi:hypothetical protein